jgi:hypothetical protein
MAREQTLLVGLRSAEEKARAEEEKNAMHTKVLTQVNFIVERKRTTPNLKIQIIFLWLGLACSVPKELVSE